MKKIAFASLLSGVLLLGVAPSAGAVTPSKKCSPYYFAPMYKHVTKITIRGGSCTTAHRIVGTYERAIVSTIGQSGSSSGVCFGRHTFGKCTITYNGRKYSCSRPVAGGTTVPAVCTRKGLTVHFKG
jgi:hypothetical protein